MLAATVAGGRPRPVAKGWGWGLRCMIQQENGWWWWWWGGGLWRQSGMLWNENPCQTVTDTSLSRAAWSNRSRHAAPQNTNKRHSKWQVATQSYSQHPSILPHQPNQRDPLTIFPQVSNRNLNTAYVSPPNNFCKNDVFVTYMKFLNAVGV